MTFSEWYKVLTDLVRLGENATFTFKDTQLVLGTLPTEMISKTDCPIFILNQLKAMVRKDFSQELLNYFLISFHQQGLTGLSTLFSFGMLKPVMSALLSLADQDKEQLLHQYHVKIENNDLDEALRTMISGLGQAIQPPNITVISEENGAYFLELTIPLYDPLKKKCEKNIGFYRLKIRIQKSHDDSPHPFEVQPVHANIVIRADTDQLSLQLLQFAGFLPTTSPLRQKYDWPYPLLRAPRDIRQIRTKELLQTVCSGSEMKEAEYEQHLIHFAINVQPSEHQSPTLFVDRAIEFYKTKNHPFIQKVLECKKQSMQKADVIVSAFYEAVLKDHLDIQVVLKDSDILVDQGVFHHRSPLLSHPDCQQLTLSQQCQLVNFVGHLSPPLTEQDGIQRIALAMVEQLIDPEPIFPLLQKAFWSSRELQTQLAFLEQLMTIYASKAYLFESFLGTLANSMELTFDDQIALIRVLDTMVSEHPKMLEESQWENFRIAREKLRERIRSSPQFRQDRSLFREDVYKTTEHSVHSRLLDSPLLTIAPYSLDFNQANHALPIEKETSEMLVKWFKGAEKEFQTVIHLTKMESHHDVPSEHVTVVSAKATVTHVLATASLATSLEDILDLPRVKQIAQNRFWIPFKTASIQASVVSPSITDGHEKAENQPFQEGIQVDKDVYEVRTLLQDPEKDKDHVCDAIRAGVALIAGSHKYPDKKININHVPPHLQPIITEIAKEFGFTTVLEAEKKKFKKNHQPLKKSSHRLIRGAVTSD